MGTKRENKREIGTVYENKAVLLLQEKGCRILERNFYTYYGEIDIIAEDDDCLVFVEVKYRKTTRKGSAAAAVTPVKQKRLRQSAGYYLYKKHYHNMEIPCRFDVIAFDGEEALHIKNAF